MDGIQDSVLRGVVLVGFVCTLLSAFLMFFVPTRSRRFKRCVVGVLVFAAVGMLGALLLPG